MGNSVFPQLAGLDWNVKRTPTFRTLLQSVANGFTVRVPQLTDPMWTFECSYEFLNEQNDDLNVLLGFFLARQGAYDSFLLNLGSLTQNPFDSAVTDQPLTIDANNCAPLVRTLGSSQYNEQIYELNGTPIIKSNGTPLVSGTDYTLYTATQTAAGTLNGNGITYAGCVVKFLHGISGAVTADFGFYYRVIFSIGKGTSQDPQLGNDQQDFEMLWQFMYEAQAITLVTARE